MYYNSWYNYYTNLHTICREGYMSHLRNHKSQSHIFAATSNVAPTGRYGTKWQNHIPHQQCHHHRHHPCHYHHSNTIIIKNWKTYAVIIIDMMARMNYDPKKVLFWRQSIWNRIGQYRWVGIVFVLVFVFRTVYFNTDGWVAGTNNNKTLSPIGEHGTTIPERSVAELRDVLGILRLILGSQLYFTSPWWGWWCQLRWWVGGGMIKKVMIMPIAKFWRPFGFGLDPFLLQKICLFWPGKICWLAWS